MTWRLALTPYLHSAGYKHWHAEIRPDDLPQEAGMLFACKLKTDQPFAGREAVERQKAEGIYRKLVTLTLPEPRPLWGLEGILLNGERAGFLRRAEHAFALDRMVGYGYVRRPDGGKVTNAFLKQASWELEVMGERVPAELHVKAPFDPQNQRLQGVYEEAPAAEEIVRAVV